MKIADSPSPEVAERLPAVSIVVPTFRRERVLLETLSAILALEPPAGEIVVVDQTSDHEPATAEALATLETDGRIRRIVLREPSIPRAMNQGLLAAAGPIVLFLDDDVMPASNLVAEHARAHAAATGVLVAGRVWQPWSHPGRADPFTSDESRDLDQFMGGNFSLFREPAVSLGGFDENFVGVAYRFEREFARRWLQAGRRIAYRPQAEVRHLKAPVGGTREYGEHLRTWRPEHAVGEFYDLLRSGGRRAWPAAVRRLAASVLTRHHLRRPWWIPGTLIAETRALAWALRLAHKGPRYLTGVERGHPDP